MRLLAVLALALVSTAVPARGVHKCQKPGGAIYYTDKACSTKNARDRKPVVDQGADPQQPAPEPPNKVRKRTQQ